MRIYIWHGYLLSGTGSNEYTRALARTLSGQGHDVTVFCQDPDPSAHNLGDVNVIVPELPGALPVFVLDHYADAHPALLTAMDASAIAEYVAANAAAIQEQGPADLLICNHLLLGGPVGAASGLRYAVKAHGSELEFAMRDRPDLCDWAAETLRGASAVIAGSAHVRGVIEELVDIPDSLIHEIPPGVDTELMRLRPRAEALPDLIAECELDPANPPDAHNERLPDAGNAARIAEFFDALAPGERPAVYVGKLSKEMGVDLLLTAATSLGLPVVVVGFGAERPALERMAGPNVLFTGPLQHRHLSRLWPLAVTSVVPSVFPEAFGMVAAEAASCGCPPVVAYHSGLAEIADGLAAHYPERFAELVSFPTRDVDALTDRLRGLVDADDTDWRAISAGAREAALSLWSWDSVARRILNLVP